MTLFARYYSDCGSQKILWWPWLDLWHQRPNLGLEYLIFTLAQPHNASIAQLLRLLLYSVKTPSSIPPQGMFYNIQTIMQHLLKYFTAGCHFLSLGYEALKRFSSKFIEISNGKLGGLLSHCVSRTQCRRKDLETHKLHYRQPTSNYEILIVAIKYHNFKETNDRERTLK